MMNYERIDKEVAELLSRMTLEEKIGQLHLISGEGGHLSDHLRHTVTEGKIGGILNEVNLDTINELQRIAVNESRMGIPLLIGRDVIHGFRTVFPIPLGQAASWNPDMIEKCARVSAKEAAASGVNWTYAPMIDIGRDPRWGRVAETMGEDPWLTGKLAKAMVRGFQGDDLSKPGNIAACAKHFAGYGASEAGRDYAATNVSENELRNVHLPPFKAAADAGVASFMTSFGDIDGVPASANEFLLKQILRREWNYNGFVVSDWESIRELSVHGLTANDKEAASEAINAGVDMEMTSDSYPNFIKDLMDEGKVTIEQIDYMVSNILRCKFRLGLFDTAHTDASIFPASGNGDYLALAKEAAAESVVMLQNNHNRLPLNHTELNKIAVIGPLSDDDYEQLGTWIFDGDPSLSQTVLQALQQSAGENIEVQYVRAMETSRSRSTEHFEEAVEAAKSADVAVLCLGEESILSGEAHCRADINLPGNQEELIAAISTTGTPVVLVILAGRPLTLQNVLGNVDSILFAWHPGTMGGPAIADILFGDRAPSGKLPVTFPKMVGQIPIYHSQKNTGRPATPESYRHIDDFEPRAHQVSLGNTSFHFDAGYKPLFPFGFGLSYTEFHYSDIQLSTSELAMGGTLEISAEVKNTGERAALEVVQLYIRDLVGNVTRPVKELKGFERVHLEAGESKRISFALHTDDLAFFNRKMEKVTEPGDFHVWIGGHSDTDLRAEFRIV